MTSLSSPSLLIFVNLCRVKSDYVHHERLSGAIGVKIVAQDISRVMAGTPVMVVQEGDDVEDVKEDVQSDIAKVHYSFDCHYSL